MPFMQYISGISQSAVSLCLAVDDLLGFTDGDSQLHAAGRTLLVQGAHDGHQDLSNNVGGTAIGHMGDTLGAAIAAAFVNDVLDAVASDVEGDALGAGTAVGGPLEGTDASGVSAVVISSISSLAGALTGYL